METAQFVESVAGRRDDPGHQVTTDDKLRALLVAMEMCDALCEEISRDTSSPTRAAFHASVVERHSQRMELAQIRAAGTAQRTLIHELPPETLTTLRNVADDPRRLHGWRGRLAGGSARRTDRAARIQEHRRGPAAHAAHLLLRGPRPAARRVVAAAPHRHQRDPSGPALPRPRRVSWTPAAPASRRLPPRPASWTGCARASRPGPTPATWPGASRSRWHVPSPRTPRGRPTSCSTPSPTGSMPPASEPTPAEIREKTGVFVTRRTRHFTYLNACMLNDDAEIFMSHFAQSDNPRTQAGDRRAMADAATVPGAGSQDAGLPRLPRTAAVVRPGPVGRARRNPSRRCGTSISATPSRTASTPRVRARTG